MKKYCFFLLLLLSNIILAEGNYNRTNWFYSVNDTLINLTKDDSLRIIDSLRKIILADSVIPIRNYNLFTKTSDRIISNDDLWMNNYFDFASNFSQLPNIFYLDLSSPSQLNNLFIKGNSWRNISVNFNNRNYLDPFTSTLNLMEINQEELDYVQLIDGPKAFIYGNNNEQISINLVRKEINSKQAFSRLKYIEAPYDNLFIDGLFNVFLLKRLNLEFGITKHSTKGRFKNSAFDIWKDHLNFVYFPSNRLNLLFSYHYTKTENQFNQGVDLEKIVLRPGQTINDILYDELQATIVNSAANQVNSKNNLDFELRGNFLKDTLSLTYLNAYFSQNERDYNDLNYKSFYFSKLLGAKFRQYFHILNADLEFIASVEQKTFDSPQWGLNKFNDFSSSILFQYDFKFVKPSLFAKYLNKNKISTLDYGGDLEILLTDNLNLYSGVSYSSYYPSYDEFKYLIINYDYQKIINIESKINYKNDWLTLSLDGFYSKSTIENNIKFDISELHYALYFNTSNFVKQIILFTPQKNITYGLSLDGLITYWKFKLSFANSYIQKKYYDFVQLPNTEIETKVNNQPEFTSNISLFYRNIHFNDNLDINVGLRLQFFTSYYGMTLIPEKEYYVNYVLIDSVRKDYTLEKIPANIKLDFVVSGKIKNSAIVYLAFENLTNAKYYLMPFYPIRDFGFRFGIAWDFYD